MSSSNEPAKSIIENMLNAYAYHKVITNEQKEPVDYQFLEANKAFEDFTGLKREQIIGKRITDIEANIVNDEFDWISFYGDIAINRKKCSFEQYSDALKKWYLINAYSSQEGYFTTIFTDITYLKIKEFELSSKNDELTSLYEELTASEEELRQQVDELNTLNTYLSESERRLRKAQALAHVGNWELDLKTYRMWGSEECFSLFGLKRESPFLDFSMLKDMVHPEDRALREESLKNLIENNTEYNIVFRIYRADNQKEKYLQSVAEIEYGCDGKPVKVLGVVRDITKRIKYQKMLESKNEELTSLYEEITASEEELRQQLEEIHRQKKLLELSEERYRTLADNTDNVIYSCDLNGTLTSVNRRFIELAQQPLKEILGKNVCDYERDEKGILNWKRAAETVKSTCKLFTYENRFEIEGEEHYTSISLAPVLNMEKKVIGITGTVNDITRIKQHERLITRMAYYDSLTGLPNRRLFFDRVNNAISISEDKKFMTAVAFIDLDNFKRVNDTMGHSVGDILLIEVAKRISRNIKGNQTVARLSGDEFSLILPDIMKREEVIATIEKINEVFEEPFILKDNSVNLTASIGIAVYPDDGSTAEELLRTADTAMYKSKELGRNRYQFYNCGMEEELIRKTTIERMMREAIGNGEFVLHYQPQYESATRKLRGFEALIRWNNSSLGTMSPVDFIPIAEETGMIVPIGIWVINTAAQVCKRIQEEYKCSMTISVNISPIQLRQKDFYNVIMDAIESSGIKASDLELEITESIFIDGSDCEAVVLEQLRQNGVKVALDDFGTGYSSLSYLKKLPIDLLKIDKSFIQGIDKSNPWVDLTDSIISLVHKMNITTIAEGVENSEQLAYLENSKCDIMQGFYLGKPIPEDLIGNIIKKGCFQV